MRLIAINDIRLLYFRLYNEFGVFILDFINIAHNIGLKALLCKKAGE